MKFVRVITFLLALIALGASGANTGGPEIRTCKDCRQGQSFSGRADRYQPRDGGRTQNAAGHRRRVFSGDRSANDRTRIKRSCAAWVLFRRLRTTRSKTKSLRSNSVARVAYLRLPPAAFRLCAQARVSARNICSKSIIPNTAANSATSPRINICIWRSICATARPGKNILNREAARWRRIEIRCEARLVCRLRRRRHNPHILYAERGPALFRTTGTDLWPTRMTKPIRANLRERGVAEHVVEAKAPRVCISRWAEFVAAVECGYRFGLDDYRNDLDIRTPDRGRRA